MRSARWSAEEIALLKEYYPKGGFELCKEKGLTRSKDSVHYKARYLNLSYNQRYTRCVDWSESDLAILREYYPIGGVMLCKEKGLDVSDAIIHYKARKLGLKIGIGKAKRKNMWGEEELALLKEYYPKGGLSLCMEKGLNKSNYSIYLKARDLGLNKIHWCEEDLALLREYYPLGGFKLCIEKGLNFSSHSIQKQAEIEGLVYRLGSNWTEEEDAILKEYYPIGGYKLCIEKGIDASRSKSAIYTRACNFKLKYIKKADR